MQALAFEAITSDEVKLPLLTEKNVRLTVLRIDKIHPVISGNKWFKLKYYLSDARSEGKEHIVTFGGPYSNHVLATAAAGELLGFGTTAVIRGEKPLTLSPSLINAMNCGMQTFFVSRDKYDRRELPIEIERYKKKICVIDEGGYGDAGVKGAAEILDYCDAGNYSHILCAAGSCTMAAGLVRAGRAGQKIVAVSVLKNNWEMERRLSNLLSQDEQKREFQVIHGYHFSGYARYSKELMDFMNDFYRHTGIPLDFVYTGKLFFATLDLIRRDALPPGSSLLVVHSGGLQGNCSLPKGMLVF